MTRRADAGTQEQLLVDWNAQNVAAGLKPAEITYFENAGDYYLALASGRLDGYLGPNPTAICHSSSKEETKIVATSSGAGDKLQGEIAALTKKDNGSIQAVQKALDRWGLGGEAIKSSAINPPGLPKTS